MYFVHVQVFFYEDILDPKWIFFIHYDPILRHVFDDALVDIEQNNDVQQNEREGLENIEEFSSMMMLKMVMFRHKKTTI